MDVLLKSVRVVYPGNSHHQKVRDFLIINGRIRQVAALVTEVPESVKTIDLKGKYVSPGWLDMRANFRDPGQEYKEDLLSGSRAAAAGGFTEVLLMPSVHTPVQSKAQVEYLLQKSKNNLVTCHVAGCLTANRAGSEMAEMFDMMQGGAVAFTDDKLASHDAGLLLRCFLYGQSVNATVIVYADEPSLSGKHLINDSVHSVNTGMKGSPAIAEEIGLSKILRVAEYAKVPVHISGISSAGSVQLLRNAKSKGIDFTAEVYAHHLMLEDEEVESFDSNLKVKPVLRSKQDIAALKKGIADGVIQVVCSDHSPHEDDAKNVEYDFAAHGISSAETTFASLNTAFKGQLPVETIVEKLALNPRNILQLPLPSINEGEMANLTVFSTEEEWTFSTDKMLSRSHNSPFNNRVFIGKVTGVINNNKIAGF
ncbi:MAG: dihydroorotase [Bacteroidia bacterium]|nr:dihydroorotase [Bacteroidia bacterium]